MCNSTIKKKKNKDKKKKRTPERSRNAGTSAGTQCPHHLTSRQTNVCAVTACCRMLCVVRMNTFDKFELAVLSCDGGYADAYGK